MQEENSPEQEQACFDILVSSLVDSVMNDEEIEFDGDDKVFIVDEILNVLNDHLDEEGLDMLNFAIEKFENEYELQIKVDDIIKSFDWHKNDTKE